VSVCEAVETNRSPYRSPSDCDTRRIQECQWSVCSFSFIQLTEHLTLDISIVLGHGNGQAGQPAQPITVNLSVTVSANMTSTRTPPKVPTEGEYTQARASDSREPDRRIAPEPIQTQSGAPTSQSQADMSLVNEARDWPLSRRGGQGIDRSI
jgi:hypothetical protein